MVQRFIDWIAMSKVSFHRGESERALVMFKKTLKDLSKANECVVVDIQEEERKIELANKTKKELTLIKESNEKFIDKINNFFE